MLTTLLRLWFSLTYPAATGDEHHEAAHHTCEILVYAVVAPDIGDDECTTLGEVTATMLCRGDPWYTPPEGVSDAEPSCK